MLKQHLKQYNERAADAVLFCYPCFDAREESILTDNSNLHFWQQRVILWIIIAILATKLKYKD